MPVLQKVRSQCYQRSTTTQIIINCCIMFTSHIVLLICVCRHIKKCRVVFNYISLDVFSCLSRKNISIGFFQALWDWWEKRQKLFSHRKYGSNAWNSMTPTKSTQKSDRDIKPCSRLYLMYQNKNGPYIVLLHNFNLAKCFAGLWSYCSYCRRYSLNIPLVKIWT